MTIRLPLYLYTSPPLEVTVDRTEDGVRLAFDLHPDELVGRIPDEVVSAAVLDRQAYAEGDEVGPLRDRIDELLAERDAVVEWNGKLLAALERVKDRASIEWEVSPEEARALASMLWHYADRVDAKR